MIYVAAGLIVSAAGLVGLVVLQEPEPVEAAGLLEHSCRLSQTIWEWNQEEPASQGGNMEEERMQILKMVEAGQIDAEEAADLLAALGTIEAKTPEEVPAEGQRRARRNLQEPRGPGSGFTPDWQAGSCSSWACCSWPWSLPPSAARGWLLCGWPLLFLGLGVILLALVEQAGHVDAPAHHRKRGQNIA